MKNIFIDNKDDRPIGVFDSGLGGLTVLNDLAKSFPNQSYIYLGDLANLPYGNKSKNNIIKCSVSCANFLIEKNVKGVIIACNTSSSYAYKKLKDSLSIPVYDVINPCAESVSKSNLKKIAIIGTEKTIESNLYFDIIQSLNKKIQIYNVACPLFVPIVEEGLENSSIAISVINMYLKKLNLITHQNHRQREHLNIKQTIGKSAKTSSRLGLQGDDFVIAIYFKKVYFSAFDNSLHI